MSKKHTNLQRRCDPHFHTFDEFKLAFGTSKPRTTPPFDPSHEQCILAHLHQHVFLLECLQVVKMVQPFAILASTCMIDNHCLFDAYETVPQFNVVHNCNVREGIRKSVWSTKQSMYTAHLLCKDSVEWTMNGSSHKATILMEFIFTFGLAPCQSHGSLRQVEEASRWEARLKLLSLLCF